jgi:hypothetical protein
MTQVRKRYNTSYKKKVDVERDVYLPRRAPKGLIFCRDCAAVYYRRRWTLAPPRKIHDRIISDNDVVSAVCPACNKIRDQFPNGELRMLGVAKREVGELFRLLRNEERRAREKNPLERIMRVITENNNLTVETTTEKLAQRLGRCLRKARGGKVLYNWSHNNKFARVLWEAKKKEI